MSKNNTYEFFASCGRGLEGLLADELRALGIKRVRPLSSGVAFFGSIEDGMRACLWLRTASRVLLILDRIAAKDSDTLYAGIYKIPWERHIAADGSLSIDAYGRNDNLRNSQFVAVRSKDAIVDRIRAKSGGDMRPSVQRERPDLLLNINLRGEKATVAIDLSGEPLHKRGYRVQSRAIAAPLKENLAAAMLLAAGWTCSSTDDKLLDPFCGSGTIVTEAALIAADRAPGLLRDYWGFSGWLQYDEDLWYTLLDQADARADAGATALSQLHKPAIIASDGDARSLQVAVESAKKANLAQFIDFRGELTPESVAKVRADYLVTNPPYGQRLSSAAQLPAVYAGLAAYIKDVQKSVSIITPDSLSETYINNVVGHAPTRWIKAMNGPIESDIRIWNLGNTDKQATDPDISAEPQGEESAVDATPFENRLRKMAKHRGKWARRSGVSCYRVYDADLPDFNVAIDLYQGAAGTKDAGKQWLHIAEYRAPRGIDEQLAHARLAEVLRIAPAVLDIPTQNVFLKRREQAKGGSQYKQSGDKHSAGTHIIEESDLRFEVDLASRLDTGIFLDHRTVRAKLREMAAGKDCLNLFAYTGTASVYMADGGAHSVTTVDLSTTYIDWAQRNMLLNRFVGKGAHQRSRAKKQLELHFETADVLRWVGEQRALRKPAYDLIFVDVPTFSNSSKMGKRTWDVQRDHVELLIGLSRLLRHEGQILFSTNLRNFKPGTEALTKARVSIEDISRQTVPTDFERSPNIHHSFMVKRLPLNKTPH